MPNISEHRLKILNPTAVKVGEQDTVKKLSLMQLCKKLPLPLCVTLERRTEERQSRKTKIKTTSNASNVRHFVNSQMASILASILEVGC